jgi:hypothetical protein
MTTETLVEKIKRIRRRLDEIEQERASLPADSLSRRSDLLDEEHTLQARLAELQDEAADEDSHLAQKEAGEASDYERMPEIPEKGEDKEPESREDGKVKKMGFLRSQFVSSLTL